jgi:exopolysaccharide biosynthesis WecB/TagA/CpsF family protein
MWSPRRFSFTYRDLTASQRFLRELDGFEESIMRDASKRNVLGVLINATDYQKTMDFVFTAARERQGAAISALAVHGLMTGVFNREHKYRLNHFDLLVPDGQPVRWALNLLYSANLKDRVYGPNLTRKICECAAAGGIPVYFYGNTGETLDLLRKQINKTWPNLQVAGMEPSKFRRLTVEEKQEVVHRIRNSGASILFVGLGCPRQEIFAFEFRETLDMPILAVGAAFPFLAGAISQAPVWMQNAGLEWLFRLVSEPKRLWRRYVYLNPAYLFLLALQALRLSRFAPDGKSPAEELFYG